VTTKRGFFNVYKFGLIRHLIGRSTVAVWSKKQGWLLFALPQVFVEDASSHLTCDIVSIPISADRVDKDGAFVFTNSTWDEVEHEAENGSIPSNGSILSSKNETIQWLLSNTKSEDDQVLTMMMVSDWALNLDPNESEEALLQAIRNSIIKPSVPSTSMKVARRQWRRRAQGAVSMLHEKK